MPQRVVICCLPHQALEQLQSAFAQRGMPIAQISEAAFLTLPREPGIAAMIYWPATGDLKTASLVLSRWSTLYPDRPLVLCLPGPMAQRVRMLSSVGHSSPVVLWLAEGGISERGATAIATVVAQLLARAPEFLIRALVDLTSADSLADVTALTETLLDRLRTGGTDAPTPSALAARCDLPLRRLQRACRRAGLPPPQRLLEWLTLIYVLAAADWEGMSIAKAAASSGISDKHLRHLRSRLLPGAPRLSASGAGDVLARAIVGFAR